MNFLEKQLDKANTAYSKMGQLSDTVTDMCSRLDLLELGQQDLVKKFRILESINLGTNDDQHFQKKTLDNLYLKVQDMEAKMSFGNTRVYGGIGNDTMARDDHPITQKLDTSL